jgi:RecB family endonuclease NucS
MPLELGLWRIDSDFQRVPPASLELEARLEEILHRDISIVAPNWMIIGRQVRTIHGKLGDLLCMDRDGNLIVIELKRGMTDREIVSQLLDYGSWVRTLRDEEIAQDLRCIPEEVSFWRAADFHQ